MIRIKKSVLAACAGLSIAALQGPAIAVEFGDRIELHGFGHQSYVRTNDNTYLGADNEGSWDSNSFSLVVTAKLDEKAKVWMHIESESGEEVVFDWAYLDYQFTPSLTGRVGQIKLPVGLSNEIVDARFLNLSTILPFLYHEESLELSESFRGISINYTQDFGSAGIELDGYFGQAVGEEDDELKHRRLIGGRVGFRPPVEGLKFLFSAYSSKLEEIETGERTNQNLWALSGEYVRGNLKLQSEYAKSKVFDVSSNTYYLQAGYTFADKWTPFVRYEYATTDKTQKNDPSFYQKSIGLGLDYKVNSNISVRVEGYNHKGYALPVASGEVEAGTGKDKWNFYAISVNYIF
jgi:Gram-negative porin